MIAMSSPDLTDVEHGAVNQILHMPFSECPWGTFPFLGLIFAYAISPVVDTDP